MNLQLKLLPKQDQGLPDDMFLILGQFTIAIDGIHVVLGQVERKVVSPELRVEGWCAQQGLDLSLLDGLGVQKSAQRDLIFFGLFLIIIHHLSPMISNVKLVLINEGNDGIIRRTTCMHLQQAAYSLWLVNGRCPRGLDRARQRNDLDDLDVKYADRCKTCHMDLQVSANRSVQYRFITQR